MAREARRRRQAGIAGAQAVQNQPKLSTQSPQVLVAGVDELTAELGHLVVGEMTAQAEHAAADSVLRLEDAHLHPRLMQPVRRGEPGDTRPHHEDLELGRPWGGLGGGLADRPATLQCNECARRSSSPQQAAPAYGLFPPTFDDFLRRAIRAQRPAGLTGGAKNGTEQR